MLEIKKERFLLLFFYFQSIIKFFSGLLTGKFKHQETDIVKNLAETRLAWTAEKPSERTFGVAPDVENYRNNDAYWKLMDGLAFIGQQHGETAGKSSWSISIKR